MAMIDASIYGQQIGPDIAGSLTKGLEIGNQLRDRKQKDEDLAKQRKMDEALKTAYSIGPNGELSFDYKKAAAATASIDPVKALTIKNQGVTQEREAMNQQRAKVLEVAKLVANADPRDQNEYNAVTSQLEAMGYELTPEDKIFNPQKFQAQKNMILSEAEKADLKYKESQIAKNYSEIAKTRAESRSGGLGLTEGQKSVDKDYAKDYNDFAAGGQQKALAAIDKLKVFRNKLDSEANNFVQAGGGPVSGSMPDMFRTQDSISLRDNIQSVANSALKATFGGAGITDSERKALAAEFYNDKLNASKNKEILDRKIKELEDGLATSQQKAQYFEKYGSLKGFSSQQEPREKKQVDIDLNLFKDVSIDPIQAEMKRRGLLE